MAWYDRILGRQKLEEEKLILLNLLSAWKRV